MEMRFLILIRFLQHKVFFKIPDALILSRSRYGVENVADHGRITLWKMQNCISGRNVPGIITDHFQKFLQMALGWEQEHFNAQSRTLDHTVSAAKVSPVKLRSLGCEHLPIVLHIDLFDWLQIRG